MTVGRPRPCHVDTARNKGQLLPKVPASKQFSHGRIIKSVASIVHQLWIWRSLQAEAQERFGTVPLHLQLKLRENLHAKRLFLGKLIMSSH